jgi:hypothetical protein
VTAGSALPSLSCLDLLARLAFLLASRRCLPLLFCPFTRLGLRGQNRGPCHVHTTCLPAWLPASHFYFLSLFLELEKKRVYQWASSWTGPGPMPPTHFFDQEHTRYCISFSKIQI